MHLWRAGEGSCPPEAYNSYLCCCAAVLLCLLCCCAAVLLIKLDQCRYVRNGIVTCYSTWVPSVRFLPLVTSRFRPRQAIYERVDIAFAVEDAAATFDVRRAVPFTAPAGEGRDRRAHPRGGLYRGHEFVGGFHAPSEAGQARDCQATSTEAGSHPLPASAKVGRPNPAGVERAAA
jgi:hypothetical protein